MTADKVVQAGEKTRSGVTLATRAAEAFDSVAAQSRELAAHAEEITVVSQRQRLGLDQIHESTRTLGRVTAVNATKADETATAATALHQHVNTVVATMQTLGAGRATASALAARHVETTEEASAADAVKSHEAGRLVLQRPATKNAAIRPEAEPGDAARSRARVADQPA